METTDTTDIAAEAMTEDEQAKRMAIVCWSNDLDRVWPTLILATTGAASASTVRVPPREAYGSVELGGPLQYEQFLALQGFGRNHGQVNYTNWTYAEPGSGVIFTVLK